MAAGLESQRWPAMRLGSLLGGSDGLLPWLPQLAPRLLESRSDKRELWLGFVMLQ